jgi:predicted transposase YbfD/YdcC
MSISFLEHFSALEDHRIPGMTTYPLDEVLLSILVGLLCRVEDFDDIEMLCTAQLDWLQQFLPFHSGIAPAQTQRRVLQGLAPRQLEEAFASWVRSLQVEVRGVVALDGKTLRGTKADADGKGALHIVSAYAHEAGLVLGQRAVEGKSNEITAIPDVLNMLEISGAIVTIDAMGTQKAIAARITEKKADYLLALKGNQRALHRDCVDFFEDPHLAAGCPVHEETSAGHGRVEVRSCRAAPAEAWLLERHPGWAGLHSIVEVTCERTVKKSGKTSRETRYYISSLAPDPAAILKASRLHWSIENNLHWQLDVSFREDENRTRKDHSARNLAMIRRVVLNMARREPAKLPLKRKRLKAAIDPEYRAKLLAC